MAKDNYIQSPSNEEILGILIKELPDVNSQSDDVISVDKRILLTVTDENPLSGELQTDSWECAFKYFFKKSKCKTYWIPMNKEFLQFENEIKKLLS